MTGTPRPDAPRLTAVADRAVLVEFDAAISDAGHDAVLRLDQALSAHAVLGLVETVPAYVSLLVVFDPLMTDHATTIRKIDALLTAPPAQMRDPANYEVAVCYDGDLAPDLDEVARRAGMSRDAVITAHMAGEYRVFMYGFAPGYAYLAGVPEDIRLDRKETPLRDVPAGSVLIAGPQCLISTLKMPTGWWIVGRSDAKILGDDPDRPFLFDVGDHITFHRVRREALQT